MPFLMAKVNIGAPLCPNPLAKWKPGQCRLRQIRQWAYKKL
jgi:hypothetical protein